MRLKTPTTAVQSQDSALVQHGEGAATTASITPLTYQATEQQPNTSSQCLVTRMAQSNILLLVADDLGKVLGCYGTSSIRTPNIDRLAAQGSKFDYAFASTASCSGSRSTIYTGMHTHQNGQYGLAGERHHFTTYEKIETAPRIFNDLGYHTGIIGKVHVGPQSVYPWSSREESWSRNVAFVAERAGAFFENSKVVDKPFFLTVGYIDPHRDRTRSGWGNEEATGGVDQGNYGPDDVEVPSFMQDLPEVREELADYYRSIHRLDQGVGLILKQLKKSGLENNTLVVFVSDNGAPFVNSKTTLYDAGVRLPLIVRKPGAKQGVENPNMVSFIDLLPTLLDFAGHPERNGGVRPGRSILPILEQNTRQPGWDRVYGSHTFHEITNYWPTRYVRTPRFKYHRNIAHQLDFPFAADLYGSISWEAIRNSSGRSGAPVFIGKRPLVSYIKRPPEELFDLHEDPDEIHDLARDPAYTKIVRELRAACEAWQARTADPWQYRDGMSLQFLKHHLAAGMPLPDRWDFDASDPGTDGKDLYHVV